MTELDKLVEAAQRGDQESVRALLEKDSQLARAKDASGATALHYAAQSGHRRTVELLVERGANMNSLDSRHGATPAGWAIEYLRELGGYLAIELDDLAYALQVGDARWVKRFLTRFPALRTGFDRNGTPFRQLGRESGNPEIAQLFEDDAT